jgi:hypothetical protein
MVTNKIVLIIFLLAVGIFSNDAIAQSQNVDQPAAGTYLSNGITPFGEKNTLNSDGDDSVPEDMAAPADKTLDISISENEMDSDSLTAEAVWQSIKGRKAVDALMLAMWSFHFDATGSLFGDGRVNEVNNLAGLQLYGFNAGTLISSHYDRAYFLGVSRRVYTKYYWDDEVRMDIGYNAGLLYGYGDELYNIGGFSAYVVPNVGFTFKGIGIDFGFVPVGVLSVGFRVDFDFLYGIGQP